MTSMLQSFQKEKSLPVSHNTTQDSTAAAAAGAGMRRRVSSMTFQIQPPTMSDTAAWALRSSKSVSSMGQSASTSIRSWWDRGWGWILSRKPVFAQDLEMNNEESSVLGCQNKVPPLEHSTKEGIYREFGRNLLEAWKGIMRSPFDQMEANASSMASTDFLLIRFFVHQIFRSSDFDFNLQHQWLPHIPL
ncbi:hypothetical protein LXL04_025269 [Taraxacum kok-saghyz]